MKIDQALLEAALVGYIHQRDQLTAKISELQQQLGHSAKAPEVGGGEKGRGMSSAARERIAEAQRKRWAAYHKKTGAKAAKKTEGPKRILSPAARKRIADATRKRWAAYRAQKAASAQG